MNFITVTELRGHYKRSVATQVFTLIYNNNKKDREDPELGLPIKERCIYLTN